MSEKLSLVRDLLALSRKADGLIQETFSHIELGDSFFEDVKSKILQMSRGEVCSGVLYDRGQGDGPLASSSIKLESSGNRNCSAAERCHVHVKKKRNDLETSRCHSISSLCKESSSSSAVATSFASSRTGAEKPSSELLGSESNRNADHDFKPTHSIDGSVKSTEKGRVGKSIGDGSLPRKRIKISSADHNEPQNLFQYSADLSKSDCSLQAGSDKTESIPLPGSAVKLGKSTRERDIKGRRSNEQRNTSLGEKSLIISSSELDRLSELGKESVSDEQKLNYSHNLEINPKLNSAISNQKRTLRPPTKRRPAVNTWKQPKGPPANKVPAVHEIKSKRPLSQNRFTGKNGQNIFNALYRNFPGKSALGRKNGSCSKKPSGSRVSFKLFRDEENSMLNSDEWLNEKFSLNLKIHSKGSENSGDHANAEVKNRFPCIVPKVRAVPKVRKYPVNSAFNFGPGVKTDQTAVKLGVFEFGSRLKTVEVPPGGVFKFDAVARSSPVRKNKPRNLAEEKKKLRELRAQKTKEKREQLEKERQEKIRARTQNSKRKLEEREEKLRAKKEQLKAGQQRGRQRVPNTFSARAKSIAEAGRTKDRASNAAAVGQRLPKKGDRGEVLEKADLVGAEPEPGAVPGTEASRIAIPVGRGKLSAKCGNDSASRGGKSAVKDANRWLEKKRHHVAVKPPPAESKGALGPAEPLSKRSRPTRKDAGPSKKIYESPTVARRIKLLCSPRTRHPYLLRSGSRSVHKTDSLLRRALAKVARSITPNKRSGSNNSEADARMRKETSDRSVQRADGTREPAKSSSLLRKALSRVAKHVGCDKKVSVPKQNGISPKHAADSKNPCTVNANHSLVDKKGNLKSFPSRNPNSSKGNSTFKSSQTNPNTTTDDLSQDSLLDKSGGVIGVKNIPLWATGVPLKQALFCQYYSPPNLEEIFGDRSKLHINLADIFDQDKSRYHRRTSSADWSSDDSF